MTRYISLPHVIGLLTAALALSFTLYIGDHRHSPIAKGVASELTIIGAPNAGTPASSLQGSSSLGPTNQRNVWFYLEGMCILGKGDVVTDCTKTCGATYPSNAAAAIEACWIPYTSSDLSVVDKCENVVLSKRTEKGTTDRAAIDKTHLGATDMTAGDDKITFKTNAHHKVACALAGCDQDALVTQTAETAAGGPVAGKCKDYGTVPTKTVPATLTANKVPGLQKGFLFKQTADLHLSINVLQGKAGVGDAGSAARAKSSAQHAFDVYKYPMDYHDANYEVWIFTLISAIAMLLGALLVLFSKAWTAGKYGGDQLPKGKPDTSRYYPSTALDAAHIIFLITNLVIAGKVGMMFKTTIDGSMADPTLEKLFWTPFILLFVGQLWVTMHGIAFSVQWMMRNKQPDPYNNGVQLAVKNVVIADHNLEQRASMVRNNLNV